MQVWTIDWTELTRVPGSVSDDFCHGALQQQQWVACARQLLQHQLARFMVAAPRPRRRQTDRRITDCGVARQHCVNGDRPSQWEMANFNPLQNRNPWADCNKIRHNWLRPWGDPQSPPNPNLVLIHPLGASGQMGEIYRFCAVLFIYLFLRLAYRSELLMDFHAQ